MSKKSNQQSKEADMDSQALSDADASENKEYQKFNDDKPSKYDTKKRNKWIKIIAAVLMFSMVLISVAWYLFYFMR